MIDETREYWIDNVKVFACILVTLGHFFQSMCTSGIISGGPVYQWFNKTIYYFHVPLFFICSGYLYQKYSKINSLDSWKKNAMKKMVVLGIPYITFATITWGLKQIFSGSVNTQANNLIYDLLIHPMSPYWYLVALFFIFLITPTFSNAKICGIVLVVSGLIRIISSEVDCYVVAIVTQNQIWFVLGMASCMFNFLKKTEKFRHLGVWLACLFFVMNIAVWYSSIESELVAFFLGLLACVTVMLLFYQQCKTQTLLSSYTMPVFLMHTIFAAGFRTVLLRAGITGEVFHFAGGLCASFVCPVIAVEIMKQTKLDFIIYPGKYIKWNAME